ncbi:hypothetical protein BH23BAC2_BH23BAC2_17860 [soil metagenome]
MRNFYKTFSALLLFSIFLYSCSTDENKEELSALEQELSMDNKGTLTVESTTYVFKATGETAKFIGNARAFDFTYSDDLKYIVSTSQAKHQGDDLIITNPDTEEFIRLFNFKDLKNNRLQFDVELSNGKKFYNLVYNSQSQLTKETNKCHDGPCRDVDEHAIGSIMEMAQGDATKACKGTVAACVNAGGTPSVTITRGNGWFNGSQSCVVTCR